MKLLSISAMSAVAMGNELAEMFSSAMAKDASNQVASSALRSAGDDRNVMDLFTLSNIFEYGCWCHFGDDKPARGPTMDSVDGFCKKWYDSKDCIGIDHADRDETCDTMIQYTDVLADLNYPFDPVHDYDALCASVNPDGDYADAEEGGCARDNCKVDAYFLRDIFNHMAFNNLNHTLSVAFGFDTDFTCKGIDRNALLPSTAAPFTTAVPVVATTGAPGTTAVPTPTWQCCGEFPDRHPYKPKGGERLCCATSGTTYTPLTLECCANGSTATIGMC
jgi:hypothetical protein